MQKLFRKKFNYKALVYLTIVLFINYLFSKVYFISGDFENYKEYYALLCLQNIFDFRYLNVRPTEILFAFIGLATEKVFFGLSVILIPVVSIYIITKYHSNRIQLTQHRILWLLLAFFINYFIAFHLQRQILSLSILILALEIRKKWLRVLILLISIGIHNISLLIILIFYINKHRAKLLLSLLLTAFIYLSTSIIAALGISYGGVEKLSSGAIALLTVLFFTSNRLRQISLILLLINLFNPYLSTRLWYSLLILYTPNIIISLETVFRAIPVKYLEHDRR